jgi:hypothetical protein
LYDAGDSVIAFNGEGFLDLQRDRERVLGHDHPFVDAVAEDLARLCRHQDSGDFVISGWKVGTKPVTFPIENGAHGGPGTEETRGFILVPETAQNQKTFVRPLDLRKMALTILGETIEKSETGETRRKNSRNRKSEVRGQESECRTAEQETAQR